MNATKFVGSGIGSKATNLFPDTINISGIFGNNQPDGGKMKKFTDKENKILDLIFDHGGVDGGHHKQWVLDQIVREITGAHYEEWVATYCGDGTEAYAWDEGIAP